MIIPPLETQRAEEILRYLGVEAREPSIDALQELVNAYVRRVPWESAFRIVQRKNTNENTPRLAEQFWEEAIQKGGGGTCFESNYAFFRLLRYLGYEGYLTVNNMRDDGMSENPSIGCHSAIIVLLNGKKFLVDVGLPIFTILPILASEYSKQSQFFTYRVYSDGENRYQIERHPHPSRNAFTLIDKPIEDATYRQRITDDYGADGLFLDKVIINKVINDQIWRFNAREEPLVIQQFIDGERIDRPLAGDIAQILAERFDMDEETLRIALEHTNTI